MMGRSITDRFDAFVMPEPMSGCWLWLGANVRDYGQFWNGKKLMLAHRWAYEYFVGPIPNGFQIDHKCFVRSCVNPEHLEAVTAHENVLRVVRSGRHYQKSKTHCMRGHAYSGSNLKLLKGGYRNCRICCINNDRQRRARQRALLAKSEPPADAAQEGEHD